MAIRNTSASDKQYGSNYKTNQWKNLPNPQVTDSEAELHILSVS